VPLPANNTSWPPKALDGILGPLGQWSAWYAGSPDALRAAYSKPVLDRPAQYRGGVSGAAARLWWGRPTGDLTARRDQIHVPIAADLCQASADLLFAEPPTITTEHKATQDRIDALVDDGLHSVLAGAHEAGAALGGTYLRVSWDETVVPDRPFLTRIDPDQAWPEFRWGRLVAVTFWWKVRDEGGTVLRHLERHELRGGTGVILHGLYEGTAQDLGRLVPLTEHPSTEGLAALVDADGAIDTLTPGLAVTYVPNQTPQRTWRTHPVGANYGRSDLDGIEPLMDALDETMSSLQRDIRLAKGRIMVARSLLQNNGPGGGASFDLDAEVFTPVEALVGRDAGALPITPVQFKIRAEEHLRVAQEWTEVILRSAGWSAQTFGEDPDASGARTATEVDSRDKRTDRTRDRKVRNWRPGVTQATTKLLLVDNALFGGRNDPTGLAVAFSDTDQESPLQLAQTAAALRNAAAASTRVRVQLVHPDWDDVQVESEVRAILAEEGMAVPDPIGDGEQIGDE
jgi:A118 family predicted phage portal protein